MQGRLLHTGEPAPLQDGDRLDVGQVTLTFRTGRGAASARADLASPPGSTERAGATGRTGTAGEDEA